MVWLCTIYTTCMNGGRKKSMAEQLSKTARRSMVQGNTVRMPFQVFKPTKRGKPHHPVASFASKAEAEAFAAEIGGYIFAWRDEARG